MKTIASFAFLLSAGVVAGHNGDEDYWSAAAPCAKTCFQNDFAATPINWYRPCATPTGFYRCLQINCPSDSAARATASMIESSMCVGCSTQPTLCPTDPFGGHSSITSTSDTHTSDHSSTYSSDDHSKTQGSDDATKTRTSDDHSQTHGSDDATQTRTSDNHSQTHTGDDHDGTHTITSTSRTVSTSPTVTVIISSTETKTSGSGGSSASSSKASTVGGVSTSSSATPTFVPASGGMKTPVGEVLGGLMVAAAAFGFAVFV